MCVLEQILEILTLTLTFDLQIHSEIDDLYQHLQARRGSYGNSLGGAQMTSQAFKQFEMTVEVRYSIILQYSDYFITKITPLICVSKDMFVKFRFKS